MNFIFNGSDPIDFENAAATACKPKPQYCEIPFSYKSQTYNSCLKRDEEYWCPTKVDENGEAIDGFWGECDINAGQTECGPNQGNILLADSISFSLFHYIKYKDVC